ncbi:MAG: GNAT family N-acetyltransferase [Chloroflexi bacterium]|nr:GNAT family N-acetyltransferase [Chloroflexota bacterium]MYC54332.1 GNAT family N-acetyltransferase [Chloroflexota bacterium]
MASPKAACKTGARRCVKQVSAQPKKGTAVEITAYQDVVAFEALAAEWNPLLRRAPIDCVFYTWEWQKTWWAAYQPGELLILACRKDGQLVGIAPLFTTESARGKTTRIIGCVDVTDYLDFIIDRDHLSEALTAFADYLQDKRASIGFLDLCNIPADSPTRQLLPNLLAERGFAVTVEQQEVCPVINLPGDWRGYLASLDKKQRHEVRRKLRRIQGSERAVDWYIVNGRHDLSHEIDTFVELMAASDPEKEQFLQDEGNQRFFRAIVPLMQARGWLQLNFLTVDEIPAASYINFLYGDRVMVYNSGHAHDAFGELSPGIVLLAYNIRHAIEQGYQYFDFLRGDEAYKYRMGGRDTAVMNIRAE